jgi:hypothetical protein
MRPYRPQLVNAVRAVIDNKEPHVEMSLRYREVIEAEKRAAIHEGTYERDLWRHLWRPLADDGESEGIE